MAFLCQHRDIGFGRFPVGSSLNGRLLLAMIAPVSARAEANRTTQSRRVQKRKSHPLDDRLKAFLLRQFVPWVAFRFHRRENAKVYYVLTPIGGRSRLRGE